MHRRAAGFSLIELMVGLTIGALLMMMGVPFFGDIDQQRKTIRRTESQVVREAGEARLVVVEHFLARQAAVLPGVGRQTVRVEIEEVVFHVLILLMTS